MRRAVAAALDDVPDGSVVVVACSGGADSLALAAGLAFLVDPTRPLHRRRVLRTGAVVVDHGWFAGSDQVAAEAARVCRELGLGAGEPDGVVVATLPAATRSDGGPEARARAGRYAVLDDEAHRRGAVAVLLGHTLDDQAETVLLGLARGSGTRSLAGMPHARGVYRRPLLTLTREQTRACCAALGLRPWDDPANADPAYARARVRAGLAGWGAGSGAGWGEQLAPVLDRSPAALAQALARTADLAREDADALDVLSARLRAEATLRVEAAPGAVPQDVVPDVVLDVAVLAAALPALRRRVLLAAVRDLGDDPEEVGREHVLAVDALLRPGCPGGARAALPGGVEAVRGRGPAYGRLTLRRTGGRGASS